MKVSSDNASEWMISGPGAKRRLLCENKALMMVEFRFETGGIGAPHHHVHTQTTYVASGLFEFTLSGETKVLKPGDGLLIPSNAVHSCICLQEGVLFDAFAPRRDDFMQAHGWPLS